MAAAEGRNPLHPGAFSRCAAVFDEKNAPAEHVVEELIELYLEARPPRWGHAFSF